MTVVGPLCMPASVAHGQVVLLPTQNRFQYRGSVLVPDGGSVYLGGNRTYASGSSRRGFRPFGSSFGSTIGSSGMSISATIIDHQEIDRQLLGGTPEEFLARERAKESARALPFSRPAPAPPSPTPSQIEAGKALVRHARKLHAAGHGERSQTAYRLALPLLTPELQQLALAESRRAANSGP